MAIIDYNDDICRDTNVIGDNVYIENPGQGCDTVWYKSVSACRALLKHLGKVPDGRDIQLCLVCSCNFSITEKGYTMYPEHVCKGYKESITKLANDILKRNPSHGRIA